MRVSLRRILDELYYPFLDRFGVSLFVIFYVILMLLSAIKLPYEAGSPEDSATEVEDADW